MVDYNPILEALKLIPKMQDDTIIFFEDTFRSIYSSISLPLLLSGKIPQSQISTLLTSSLEATAQYCLEKSDHDHDPTYRDIANMLWNPLTATLFKVIASTCKTANDLPKALQSRTTRDKVKPKPVDLPSTQISAVRHRLKEITLTKTHVYKTPGHMHVKCDTANCEFCKHLFNNLNITKCEGHKRCSKVGWYPHIGPALWQMLRKKHANKAIPNLPPKPCSAHEIPALSVDTARFPLNKEVPANAESEDSSPVESGRSTPMNVGSVSNSPKRAWADDFDVEDFYLRGQKRKPGSVATTSDKV